MSKRDSLLLLRSPCAKVNALLSVIPSHGEPSPLRPHPLAVKSVCTTAESPLAAAAPRCRHPSVHPSAPSAAWPKDLCD